jgi:hypothetical protein
VGDKHYLLMESVLPPFKLPTFDEVLIEWNSIGSVGDLKGIIDKLT